MVEPVWDEPFQRYLLAATLDDLLGYRPGMLDPDTFHLTLAPLVSEALRLRKELGVWPAPRLLLRLLPPEHHPALERVRRVSTSEKAWAAREGARLLTLAALRNYLDEAQEIVEGPPDGWPRLPMLLQDALRGPTRPTTLLSYGDGVLERHQEPAAATGHLVAPTGLRPLDEAMDGGLKGGELGLILGPTKRGKSHVAVWLGVQALRAGMPVLHVTLELRDSLTAARYDRCLTGRTRDEIRYDPDSFLAEWEALVPDPRKLRIEWAPKWSIGSADVGDLLREAMDAWGEPGLLIVDYGALLRPSLKEEPHKEIGRVHQDLSNIGQTHRVPVWTPFQTNRSPLLAENGKVHMGHAGESYASMQHADVVMTLNQTDVDATRGVMNIGLDGARDTRKGSVRVFADWSRTLLREDTT